MQNRKGDPEQLSDEGSRRIVAAFALKPELIAEDAPCRLGDIGITVRKKIIATGFTRKYNGSALVYMQISKSGGEDRPRLRMPFAAPGRSKEIHYLCGLPRTLVAAD